MSGDQDLCLHGGAHLRGRQAEVCGEGDERQPEARHKVGTGSVYVFYSPVITKYTHRQVHEAYQYLVSKKKKVSGRTMADNWNLSRRKSVGVALLNMAPAKEVRQKRRN